jgi:hypothetical protein
MTRPTAAPARFPYREHRTMAEVIAWENRADRFEELTHEGHMAAGSARLLKAIQRERAA